MLIKDVLQELNGVKQLRTADLGFSIQKFQEQGGKVYQGHFSTVYDHPKWDHVWKTFAHSQAYLQFLEIVKAQPNNPHFPRIYRTKRIVPPYARPETHPYLWAVKMERLSPLSSDNVKLVKACRDVLNGVRGSIDELKQTNPQAMGLLRSIQMLNDARGRQKPQVYDDLHKAENYMQRKDGTVVITDPWFDEPKLKSTNVRLSGGSLDRLKEGLIGTKRFRRSYKSQVLDEFIKSGGTVNNDGSFSTILMHPRWNYVWKTFPRDGGYLHYLDFISRNPSPYFPVVLKKKQIVPPYARSNDQPMLWAVKLEKLLPISGPNWKLVREARAVLYHWMSREQFEAKYPKHVSLLDAMVDLETAYKESPPNTRDDRDRRVNYMQRPNGTIVITDPFWSNDPSEKHTGWLAGSTLDTLDQTTRL